MKSLFLCITFLAFCATASAQLKKSDFLKPQPTIERSVWRPYGGMTVISTMTCGIGVAADMGSSRGGYEGNPLLRNQDGSPNLKIGMVAGIVACGVPFIIERRHSKVASFLRFGIGIAHGVIAVHNMRVAR